MRKNFLGAFFLSTAIAAPAALLAPGSSFAQTAPTPAAAPAIVSVSSDSALSSNLVGLTVANAGNESIGEIKDLVVGANHMLEGFIVSVGGFLGMGEHYVVLAPSTVAITYNATDKKWNARVNATADELKAAPAFKYEGKWQQ